MTRKQILEIIDVVKKYERDPVFISDSDIIIGYEYSLGCHYDKAEDNWKIYSVGERGDKYIWYTEQDESTAYIKLLGQITWRLKSDARNNVIKRYHEVVSLSERLEISKNELIESNFNDFNDYTSFDVHIIFLTEIPDDLREKWAREFIEEQVAKFNLEEYNTLRKLKGILGNGLMYKDFELMDRFYNMLCRYKNISVENKESIICAISQLMSFTETEKRNGKYIISSTEEQKKYLLKLCDLAEEIFASIDLDNLNYVALVGRYSHRFNDESRLSDFKEYLVKDISSIRKNRKIIGL